MPCGSLYEKFHGNDKDYIYALVDETHVFYVGRTSNPKRRFREHVNGRSGSGSENIPPEIRAEFRMKILEETTYKDAHEAEAKLIQELKPEYNKRMSMPRAERARLDAIRERERYGPVMTKEERALARKKGPPMECECGKKWDYTVVGGHLKTHRKSNKHVAYLASLHVASPVIAVTSELSERRSVKDLKAALAARGISTEGMTSRAELECALGV
jgi:predicted GIY-YIG superfamily endonuclease